MADDDKKSFLANLVENTPLAIIVLGICLVVLGAAGGWQEHGLSIKGFGWQIALVVIGILTSAAGLILYREVKTPGAIDAQKYGLKIVQPAEGQSVSGNFDVVGTYKQKPKTDFDVVVFELSPTSQEYWPKRRVLFNNQKWEAVDIHVGGKSNDKRILIVAVVGKAGQALLRYYEKSTSGTGKYPGIKELTPDTVECDRITVLNSNPVKVA